MIFAKGFPARLESWSRASWRGLLIVCGCLLLAGSPAPLVAQGPEPEPGPSWEGVRGKLLEMIDRLEGLPGFDAERIDIARAELASLSPQGLELVSRKLSSLPTWQQLPDVLHELARLQAEQQEALLEAYLAEPGSDRDPRAEMERFRSEMLFFVARLRAFAPMIDDPEFEARLDRAQSKIRALPEESLPTLRTKYYRWAPGWKARLGTGRVPPGHKLLFGSCDMNCSFPDVECYVDEIGCDVDEAASQVTDFLDAIASFVDDIFDDISNFFTQTIPDTIDTIGDFFTELGNDLIGLLEDLLNAIAGEIPDASALLSLMGADFSSQAAAAIFFADLVDSLPVISIPCPNVGVEIPLYGTVGTPRAEYVCKRGIDWLSEKLFALIPEDSPSVPLKIGGALLYFPIKYFCMCMEAQSALCFADGQKTHRELVAQQLDAALSTRATQASVDALDGTVAALDASVADVQADVVDLDADVVVVASELALADSKADDLSSAQDDTTTLLEEFLSLEVRLDIEENLLTDTLAPEAAFQFPEGAGGFLEVVSGIVAETIDQTLAVGQGVGDADFWFARGTALSHEGSFEKAYLAFRKAYREAVAPVN